MASQSTSGGTATSCRSVSVNCAQRCEPRKTSHGRDTRACCAAPRHGTLPCDAALGFAILCIALRHTAPPGIIPEVDTKGWYIGEAGSTCALTCALQGRTCVSADMSARLDTVRAEQQETIVLSLLMELGETCYTISESDSETPTLGVKGSNDCWWNNEEANEGSFAGDYCGANDVDRPLCYCEGLCTRPQNIAAFLSSAFHVSTCLSFLRRKIPLPCPLAQNCGSNSKVPAAQATTAIQHGAAQPLLVTNKPRPLVHRTACAWAMQ